MPYEEFSCGIFFVKLYDKVKEKANEIQRMVTRMA